MTFDQQEYMCMSLLLMCHEPEFDVTMATGKLLNSTVLLVIGLRAIMEVVGWWQCGTSEQVVIGAFFKSSWLPA